MIAGAELLVLYRPCPRLDGRGVPERDVTAALALVLGYRNPVNADRLAARLQKRLPDLSWEDIRGREQVERQRFQEERLQQASQSRECERADAETEGGKVPTKLHGHYCSVCRRFRANEKFSGKGHARHICQDCLRARRQQLRQKRWAPLASLPVEKMPAVGTEDER